MKTFYSALFVSWKVFLPRNEVLVYFSAKPFSKRNILCVIYSVSKFAFALFKYFSFVLLQPFRTVAEFLIQNGLFSILVIQFFLRLKILCYLHVCSQSKRKIYVDIPLSFLGRLSAMSKLFRGWFTIKNFNMETFFPLYYRFITKEVQFF